MGPAWLATARPVADNWDALEEASGDVPFILDNEDVGVGSRWVIVDVPLQAIELGSCRESVEEREARLDNIRAVPAEELFRPILECSPQGRVRIIDGGHRIEVAAARGNTVIDSLVRLL